MSITKISQFRNRGKLTLENSFLEYIGYKIFFFQNILTEYPGVSFPRLRNHLVTKLTDFGDSQEYFQ